MADYKKEWKAIQLDWDVVSEFDAIKLVFQCMTQQEQNILIACLKMAQWRTRWINLPESNDLVVIDNLIGKLMENTTCCDAIAECIKSPTIINIINEIIRGGGATGGGGQTGGGSVNTCNPDVLWGAVSYIVDYQIEKMVDFLEKVEVATNLLEILDEWGALAGGIFGFISPFMLDWLAWFQENIAENYVSAVTIEYKEARKCELFCLYLDKCPEMLTYQELGEFWLSKVVEQDWFDSTISLLSFMTTGIWTGSQVADIMHMAMIGLQIVEDSIGWLNISNMSQLDTIFALGANDPSNDWAILCDTCILNLCQPFDSLDNVTIIRGVWDAGIGNPMPSISNDVTVAGAGDEYPFNGDGTGYLLGTAVSWDITPSTILEVKFDYRMIHDVDERVGFGIELRDSMDALVYRNVVVNDNNANGNWHTAVWGSLSEADVVKVVAWAFRNPATALVGNVQIDNICLTYSL